MQTFNYDDFRVGTQKFTSVSALASIMKQGLNCIAEMDRRCSIGCACAAINETEIYTVRVQNAGDVMVSDAATTRYATYNEHMRQRGGKRKTKEKTNQCVLPLPVPSMSPIQRYVRWWSPHRHSVHTERSTRQSHRRGRPIQTDGHLQTHPEGQRALVSVLKCAANPG